MRIRKFPEGQPAEWCHNDCARPAGRGTMTRTATHVAWIIDRHTYLCGPCAKRWRTVWDGALEGS